MTSSHPVRAVRGAAGLRRGDGGHRLGEQGVVFLQALVVPQLGNARQVPDFQPPTAALNPVQLFDIFDVDHALGPIDALFEAVQQIRASGQNFRLAPARVQ